MSVNGTLFANEFLAVIVVADGIIAADRVLVRTSDHCDHVVWIKSI